MTFAAAIVVFGGLGWWLDRQFDSTPLCLLIGMLIGIAGGFVHLIHAVAPELLPFGRTRSGEVPTPGPSTTGDPLPPSRSRPSTERTFGDSSAELRPTDSRSPHRTDPDSDPDPDPDSDPDQTAPDR